jgi:uncharacterized protein involved in outer membrane biogenesis
MTKPDSSKPAKRRSWRRRLLFISGGLFVLLLVAYFVVTSSVFFKGVILPRASKSVGGQITVAEASISPFSQIHLRNLKIQTTGTEPLLQAEDVRLRYSLWSILRGTLKADEVTVVSPVVQIIENADGTSNLDPLVKKEEKPATKPSPQSTKPPQIDLKNFALKNAVVRRVKNLKDGGWEVTELSGVNITLDQFKNGQPGKLTMAAGLKMTRPTNDVLEARIGGNMEFTLGADLIPLVLKAKVEQEVLKAEGSLRELAGHRTTFTGDVTPTEVKEFSLRFNQGDKLLGELKATGPLDLARKEGRLKLEITSIDRQVLNLIGAPMGVDFGTTTLNSTTEISLTQGGSIIAANTRFNAAKFSLTQKGQTTPPLDLQLACNVTVNTATESAEVQTFTLDGTQNQKPLLRGSLSRPMTLAWGKNAAATGDSVLELAVTDFDLAAWKPFIGDAVSAGRLSAQVNLISEQGGKQLKLGVTSQIADLSAQLGEKSLTQAALTVKLNGQVTDFKKINLSEYRLDLTQQAQPALTVSGSAGFDGAAFDLQTQIEAVMARLLGSGPATPLTVGVKLDGTFINQVLDLRQLQLALTPTQRAPKNELNVTGHFDLSTSTTKGRLNIKADTFDVTQLYDAFAGENSSATTPAGAPTQPSPASSAGNVEPDAVNLPLQLTAEANLGRVYLHEIAITNWQTTAKVDSGKFALDPCQLTLNGAPVTASVDLNLGVKGYIYAFSMLMDKVPLEPIANTFSPADRGKYRGLILASAQIKGAGVTDASLQKNLSGQVSFTFTNANIELVGPKTKRLIVPIAALLRVNEITQTPLNWLDAQTELGGGNLRLNRFTVQSEAFEARTQGVIPLAQVLTNSPLNLPVEFSLRRSLAEKSSLLPPNTPPDARYAMLPKFVTLKGTLGDPKSDLNELALGGMLLKSGVGVAEKLGVNVGGKTGDAIKGVGNLLTGQRPANTNQSGTNAAPKFNPLDLFKKK